jgi:zinc transporter, ZIP family
MNDIPVIYIGTTASLLAGLATGIGALPILFIRSASRRTQDTMLGFGAGVMLAATSFSLIIPAIDAAEIMTMSKSTAAIIVAFGILLGGAFLWVTNQLSPHEHFVKGREGKSVAGLKRIWLFIIAITIHNFPEGLAVGVGFGGGNVQNGISLAIGIGLQNMPEGFVVALALTTENYSRREALWIALLTGLVEPIGGLFGAGVVSIAAPILPWALAFAAGAMLFVISDEIIPETHRQGYEKEATAGLMVGFVVMMMLDVALG